MEARSCERRRGKRFTLSLPVQLYEAGGITRDISTSGIFFEADTAPAIGNAIELTVHFADTIMQCERRVVRVEKLDGKFGVAVEMASYSFR